MELLELLCDHSGRLPAEKADEAKFFEEIGRAVSAGWTGSDVTASLTLRMEQFQYLLDFLREEYLKHLPIYQIGGTDSSRCLPLRPSCFWFSPSSFGLPSLFPSLIFDALEKITIEERVSHNQKSLKDYQIVSQLGMVDGRATFLVRRQDPSTKTIDLSCTFLL